MLLGALNDLSSLPPLHAVVQALHRRYGTCLDTIESLLYSNITVDELFRLYPDHPVSTS